MDGRSVSGSKLLSAILFGSVLVSGCSASHTATPSEAPVAEAPTTDAPMPSPTGCTGELEDQFNACTASLDEISPELDPIACRCACDAGAISSCLNLSAIYVNTERAALAVAPMELLCEHGEALGCVNLSSIHSALEDFDEAVRVVRPLCETGMVIACVNASWGALGAGRGELAAHFSRQGLGEDPTIASLHLNLGHALALQEDLDGARKAYAVAHKFDASILPILVGDLEELAKIVPVARGTFETLRAEYAEVVADEAPVTMRQVTEEELAESKEKKTLVLAAGREHRGPGEPVSAPEVEARCAAILGSIVEGKLTEAVPAFAEVVILGPALWATVRKSVTGLGKPVTFVLPTTNEAVRLEGRALMTSDILPLLRTEAFLEAITPAREPGPRAATREERAVVYAMVPYEIEGEPVTVLGQKKERLLMMITDGRIAHLDLIGLYR